jgi:uncharacterized membrane protein YqjE
LNFLDHLRLAAKAVFTHLDLHSRLFLVEWAEEKSRLKYLGLTAMLGFVFLLCSVLMLSALLVLLTWNTDYRIAVFIGLASFYCAASLLCVYFFCRFSQQNGARFSATKAEIVEDIDLLRSRL